MKAALIQVRVSERETPQERWMRVEEILHGLQGQSIDLISLPELWSTGFSNFDRYAHEAEPLEGTTVLRLSSWARRLHCHIFTGSFVEQSGAARYNTTAALDSNGFLCGSYRKMHLFGYASRERELLTAGKQTADLFTPYGIIGLATCYDLRFPEQFRRMTDKGATVFSIAAAWPKERLDDWRLFCRVRALENQAFLLACNHTGIHGGVQGAGHSMAIAPDGTILAEAGEEEEVLTVQLDLNEAQRFREKFPALHDRISID